MKQMSVVLCDSDETYLQAFAAYLAAHIPWMSIVSYTEESAFLQDEREYGIGILSGSFLQVMEFSGRENIREKLYLCDDAVLEEYRHLPMVYKYQSMDVVVEMLDKIRQRRPEGQAGSCYLGETQVYGIYSPISHELQLPFSLALSRELSKQGRVLFLDLEELSIMPQLIERDWDRNLLDALYVMEGTGGEKMDMSPFICQFMGVDYIPPFESPEDISGVKREQWQKFFRSLGGMPYRYIVVLFGRAVDGFREMAGCCQKLLLLNKPGDFYQKSQRCFMDYADKAGLDSEITPVQLPMSAGNLSDGAYLLEELIQGNLGGYVRRQMEEGLIPIRRAAANGGG